MRILIHTQYYPPEMGAPQARLSDLARRLRNLGHDVRVLTALPNYPTGRIFTGYGNWWKTENREGVIVYRSWILPSKSTRLVPRLISYLSFVISSLVMGAVRLGKCDVVITESPPIFLCISGWLLARSKQARWILNVSDLWPDSARDVGMMSENGFAYRVLRGLAHFCYRKAWFVSGQSLGIIREVERQVPGTVIHHLSNGVDVQRFHPGAAEPAIRRRYLKSGEKGVVYAGLHGVFQGLDQILDAAEQLRDRPVRFLFFGDGPERVRLMNRARQRALRNVDFYPPVLHEEIPGILASMDAAVISLKTKIKGAVPSKIYEAMASGLPVFLLASGESSSIVTKNRAGIAVAPGNIDGFVSAIERLLRYPEQFEAMAREARVAAVRRYDREKIARRFDQRLRQ